MAYRSAMEGADPKTRASRPPALRGVLRKGASRFSRMAVRDYLARDWTAFFVHAGTGLEQLAKAYLASIDPSLVADGRSFDSLLHACGKGVHARTPREAMRTIGAADALTRCGQILPAIANMREEVDVLVQSRNGAIHIGEASGRRAERSLIAFLRASRQLLGEGGWDESAYWGKFKDFVDTRLSESANAARIRVASLVAKAQVEFDQRFARIDEEMRKAMLATIIATYVPSSDEDQMLDCPACGTEVMASGSLEVDWQPEFERDEFEDPVISDVYPEVSFFPGHLDCRACGLVLDGQEELVAAGVPDSIGLVDFDPERFYLELMSDEELT